MSPVVTGWRDHLFGLGLCVVYVALLAGTAGDLAMSRDESFYVAASESYARWFELLLDDPAAALDQATIDRYWENNHEHPSLPKSLFALSWLAHRTWDLFPTESLAHRFPAMVMAGLLVWLLYVFGARVFGRFAGGAAAVAFALMPRVFYHAHLNCFDVPITLMVTLVAYCYFRSLDDRRWAVLTGLAYGLALATKHNAWILPGILLVHFAWVASHERAARRRGEPARVRYVPYWLVAMIALGPPVFLGSWPWLWDDTLARFEWYASFHLSHVHYNVAYLGVTYFRPPFPVGVPFLLTLFTVPAATLALALAALAARARALLPGPLARRWWPCGAIEPDRLHVDVLLFGLLAAPILVIALPSTPIFGGTKHWFPAYPALALFAGYGLVRVAEALRDRLPARVPRPALVAPALAALVMLLPSATDTAHSHPYALSHYTHAAGGVAGAADYGMNRQFWGMSTGGVAAWLTGQLPQGGTVYLSDMTAGAWAMMQKDGLVPERIRPSGDILRADFALVHHEDHFLEEELQAWVAYGSVRPAHVLTYDGVPIITVYENPNRRR